MNHKLKNDNLLQVRLTGQDEVNPNDMQVIKYIFNLYYFIIHAVVMWVGGFGKKRTRRERERERRRVACWIQPLESSTIWYSIVGIGDFRQSYNRVGPGGSTKK